MLDHEEEFRTEEAEDDPVIPFVLLLILLVLVRVFV